MKGISIYMALIILFNINFRSVCVGGDKDKQNSGHDATQKSCNKEKAVLNQKKEDLSEREQETKNSEIKDTTVPREQMTAESNHMQRFTHTAMTIGLLTDVIAYMKEIILITTIFLMKET